MFLFSGSHKRSQEKMMHSDPTRSWSELLDLVRRGLMVRTDSRLVREGEVFVAVSGAKVDGADFIPAAIERGAKYIVTSQAERVSTDRDVRVILRPDVPSSLGELADAYFKTSQQHLKVVGITGTNGKTTTAFIIEHLLASAGLKVGVLGTVFYRWPGFSLDATLTTPDCWTLHELMANMEKSDVDAVIMEVSSHSIDQQRIAGLNFATAVLTNVTQDHLDYHGDMETYFRAKAKLFRELPSPTKTCIVNYDDPYGARLVKELPNVLGYGLNYPKPVPNCLVGRIKDSSSKGFTLDVRGPERHWSITTGLIGEHNAQNLLAAQGVALSLGLNPKEFQHLKTFPGVPGRLERVRNDRSLDIFVDYAHTPDALVNVQRTLRGLTTGRLITVFGCGGDRDRAKRPLMARAVARFSDVAVLTSDNPRHENPLDIMSDARPGLEGCPKIIEEQDRGTAIQMAVGLMRQNDVLLIAGKGHESYQQIGDMKIDFNDLAVTAAAVEALA